MTAKRRLAPLLMAAWMACPFGNPQGQELSYGRVHQMLPTATPDVSMATGDIDSDGDADIISGDFRLLGLENRDQGRFGEYLRIYGPHQVDSMADLDADGDADLLTIELMPSLQSPPQPLGVWVNPGAGAFITPDSLLKPTQGDLGDALAGDLDGDGDLDVYGYAASANSIALDTTFMNVGPGSFVRRNLSLPPANRTEAARLGDLDGDGDVDVLRYGALQTVVVWSNDGLGFFAPAAVQPPLGASLGAQNLSIEDLDLDGDADFLVGNPPQLLKNDGTGAFTNAGAIVSAAGLVFLADVDGDRDADVTLQATNGTCALYLNRERGFVGTPGAFPASRLSAGGLLFVDVDRDEDVDLVAKGSGFPPLWLNDGRGHFADVSVDAWEGAPLHGGPTAAGDLDGDRFPDLVCVQNPSFGQSSAELLLFHNDGRGAFVPRTLPFSLPAANRISLLDLDGDEDLDLLIRTSTFVLLQAVGPGEFRDASQNFPSPLPGILNHVVGDVDADGDADVLTTDGRDGFLWLNDGSGRFARATGAMPSPVPFEMQLADVDEDEDLDLWVGSTRLVRDTLWTFDGMGGFVDSSANLQTSVGPSEHGTFVDLDGDGDADLLTVREGCDEPPFCVGHADSLLNDGTGQLSSVQGLWENPTFVSVPMTPVDLDSDGDMDVLGGCYVWLNDGNGTLSSDFGLLPYCPQGSLVPADLDLDRDVDMVIEYPLSVFSNLQRHVSWRSYPRAGKPLTMEVSGPAGTPFQLFSSPRFTEPQPSDFGYLRLATRGARLVATGTLDAEGKAAVTLGVPSDLALPESTVYWQALVGSPPRLTNLEFTTFSNL